MVPCVTEGNPQNPWKAMKTMKNHENPWKPWKTMKNHENHENPWKYSILGRNCKTHEIRGRHMWTSAWQKVAIRYATHSNVVNCASDRTHLFWNSLNTTGKLFSQLQNMVESYDYMKMSKNLKIHENPTFMVFHGFSKFFILLAKNPPKWAEK